MRCESIVDNLKLRGHEMLVLTSLHGMINEIVDENVARRLVLNGVYGHPPVLEMAALKPLELHNHAVLRETLEQFQPDLILVFSLRGLSKSLIFGLQQARKPVVYDVADPWLAEDIKQDPWLRWWNHTGGNALRKLQELTGQRTKVDALAPTRPLPTQNRLPELFGDGVKVPAAVPNSITSFRFDHIYFISESLKQATEQAGFKVSHAQVISPGIATQTFVSEVKPPTAPMEKLLFVGRLAKRCGLLTAARAMQVLRTKQVKASLSVYGRGDSGYVAEARSFISLQRLPVEFLPVSNAQRDLPALFRQHDCLLYTAEEPEACPLTPLQAMVSGLPVIGTAVGGTCELFRHGENALTFTPRAHEELAARIMELGSQPALRCKIAETGQAEVMSKFSETVMMDQIEGCLETARQNWQAH